jgi:hypothetical protein
MTQLDWLELISRLLLVEKPTKKITHKTHPGAILGGFIGQRVCSVTNCCFKRSWIIGNLFSYTIPEVPFGLTPG